MDLSGNKLTFSSEQLKDFKQLLLFVTFLFPSRKEWNQNLNRTNGPVSIDISQSVIKNNYTTIQYLNKVKTADTKLDINRCFSLLGNRNFTRWWCPCCPSNHQLPLGKNGATCQNMPFKSSNLLSNIPVCWSSSKSKNLVLITSFPHHVLYPSHVCSLFMLHTVAHISPLTAPAAVYTHSVFQVRSLTSATLLLLNSAVHTFKLWLLGNKASRKTLCW